MTVSSLELSFSGFLTGQWDIRQDGEDSIRTRAGVQMTLMILGDAFTLWCLFPFLYNWQTLFYNIRLRSTTQWLDVVV